MIIAKFIAAVVIAYLLGSIPFGLIIGKLKGSVDVRKYGSGKVKAAGAVVLAGVIIDSGALTIGSIPLHQMAQVTAGLAAVAGHNWPVFARFKGGRGVTAYFGTLFVIYPPAAIFGVEVLAISALRSRHMSLGSILGVLAAWCLLVPLTIIYDSPPIYLAYGLAAIVLLIYQHRGNISRLQQGTERRLW